MRDRYDPSRTKPSDEVKGLVDRLRRGEEPSRDELMSLHSANGAWAQVCITRLDTAWLLRLAQVEALHLRQAAWRLLGAVANEPGVRECILAAWRKSDSFWDEQACLLWRVLNYAEKEPHLAEEAKGIVLSHLDEYYDGLVWYCRLAEKRQELAHGATEWHLFREFIQAGLIKGRSFWAATSPRLWALLLGAGACPDKAWVQSLIAQYWDDPDPLRHEMLCRLAVDLDVQPGVDESGARPPSGQSPGEKGDRT